MHARQLVIPVLFLLFAGFGAEVACAEALPRDGYSGVVSKADKRKPGQQFTFANLRVQRPFVTFPSGNGEETTKAFEDDETIVLIFVAHLTGSTETFYLNKKRNRFTLIEVGALEATATEQPSVLPLHMARSNKHLLPNPAFEWDAPKAARPSI